MSDYRTYFRSSTFPYNGSAFETAVYTQERFVFTTTATTLVGAWTPTSIGRQNVCSLIRVSCQEAANPADVVELKTSFGELIQSEALTPQGTTFMFAMPDDVITVTSAGLTPIEILVNDLTDDQLIEYINGLIASGQGGIVPAPIDQANITVTATQVIPQYPGQLIVHVQNPLAATLTLPALAGLPLGATITFIKEIGVGLVTVVPPGGVTINGIANLQTLFKTLGDSNTFLVVDGGWERIKGDVLSYSEQILLAPGNVNTVGGNLVCNLALAADGDVVLPLLSTIPIGTKITFVRTGGIGVPRIVVSDPTDRVNGQAGPLLSDTEWFLRNATDSITYTKLAVDSGSGSFQWQREFGTQANVLFVCGAGVNFLPPFTQGTQYVFNVFTATLELPPVLSVRDGCRVCVQNGTIFGDILQINAAAGDNIYPSFDVNNNSFVIAGTGSATFEKSGFSNAWVAISSSNQYGSSVTSAANITLDLPTAIASNRSTYIEMTGGAAQTLTLPPLTGTQPGTRIIVFNNTAADSHNIIPDGADLIQGLNAPYADVAGAVASIEAGLPTQGWFVIQGA